MTGFVLFGSILFVLLGTIIWAAIRAGEDTGVALDPDERVAAAIEALRDLEFEFRTGKVSDADYSRLRPRLEREALRARDAVDGSPATDGCAVCGVTLDGTESFCPSCGAATGV